MDLHQTKAAAAPRPRTSSRPHKSRAVLAIVSSRRRNCSTAPLTEPYVRTTHTALWTDVSEWQHKLP